MRIARDAFDAERRRDAATASREASREGEDARDAATTRGNDASPIDEIGAEDDARRVRNRARAKSARGRAAVIEDARSRTTRRRANAAAAGGFLLDGFDERRRVARRPVRSARDRARRLRSDAASARSLARARAAHRSRERARERRRAASAAGGVDSAFVVVVVVVVVVDRSVGSSVVRGDGVSGNESARGVAGARASAVAGANSKLASASASSVGVAAGVRRSFSLTALSSFGTNRSLIVSRSIADVLASLARVEGVAPSPRRRTDACALTRRASTRAAYASYASNAADPFFATYA